MQFLTKNTYGFKHQKVQILYIRKPPTKITLIHFLLLSRAKYSEIILQITMKGI